MKTGLKWILRIVGGLAALLVLAGVVLFAVSSAKLNKVYVLADETVTVQNDADSIANGKRLTYARGCVDCHGEDLAGRNFFNDPMLGIIDASNLTSGQGGIAASYSDADWVRAIRHGVGPDGKSLLVMPSNEFNGLSAGDLADIITYARSLAVDTPEQQRTLGPIGRVVVALDALPIVVAENVDHSLPLVDTVEREPSVAYGAYLSTTCHGCHGPDLAGGPMAGSQPGDLPAANLTPGGPMAGWTLADFKRAIREGTRPDGTIVDEKMPWKYMGVALTDQELEAIWMYLQSLPAAVASQ